MVAYSFKQIFVPPILSGAKRQTIRADRKGRSRHARPGEELQLYTGMRTKYCQKIGIATCTSADGIYMQILRPLIQVPNLNISVYRPADLDEFARADGFPDWTHMQDFWKANHPGIAVFTGTMIRWGGFRAP